MSNIYIQEPPTIGKVLLKTTVGDIDVELWSKECPKTCRNFIQLCLEGYYDGLVFHRLVRNFIVQGGDPTGTGHGGESVYGHPFKDEFHSRLRFNRRGLLGMANAGQHDNGSQFFFTLGEAGELNNKHTLFGKVAGKTVYNMIRLGEGEIGPEERPTSLHKIIKTEVLSNPFDDIVPRVLPKRQKNEDKVSKKVSKSKATKDFKLLSFGEEAEEDEEAINEVTEQMRGKSKSSHDLTDDPKLSSETAIDVDDSVKKLQKKRKESDSGEEESDEEKDKSLESIKKKLKKDPKPQEEKVENPDDSDTSSKKLSRKEELQNEVKALQKELKEARKRREGKDDDSEKDIPTSQTEQHSDAIAEFKAERAKYKDVKRVNAKKGSSREDETLKILERFKARLASVQAGSSDEDETKKDDTIEKDKEDSDTDADVVADDTWLRHKLNCDESRAIALDANVEELNRYEIHDPRNPIVKRRREKSEKVMKGKR